MEDGTKSSDHTAKLKKRGKDKKEDKAPKKKQKTSDKWGLCSNAKWAAQVS